jgi:hypothetical protein
MRITSAGNVGIGNPVSLLPDSGNQLRLCLGSETAASGGGFYIVSNMGAAINQSLGNLNWVNYAITAAEKRTASINADLDGAIGSGLIRFFTNGGAGLGERMRITSAGLVGIGTTAPSYLLDVRQGGTGPVVVAQFANTDSAAATSEARIVFNQGGSWYQGVSGKYDSGTKSLIFAAGPTANTWTERMRVVGSTGMVGIGTAAPQVMLHVSRLNAGAQGGAIMIDNPGGGTGSTNLLSFADMTMAQPQLCQIISANDGASSAHLIFMSKVPGGPGNGMRESMRIASNGNIGINIGAPSYALQISTDSAAKPSTNTWTIASDGRLKRNIRPFTRGLETLRQLRPISYEYNGEGGMPEGLAGVGLIAQEAQKVYEGFVRKSHGEIAGEETDILWTNTSDMAYMVLNALKEIDERLRKLEV